MKAFHSNKQVSVLWSTDLIIKKAYSYLLQLGTYRNRFHSILKVIRFDDVRTRQERNALDELASLLEGDDNLLDSNSENVTMEIWCEKKEDIVFPYLMEQILIIENLECRSYLLEEMDLAQFIEEPYTDMVELDEKKEGGKRRKKRRKEKRKLQKKKEISLIREGRQKMLSHRLSKE
ncbi:hypothetical protein ILUMI_19410 [Ignelater luminosus]|uniref:Uncharacterized protein n=1 Tax=Ignelater luminosus TaxID=2038154 RepID=A0A8K0CMG6_IGNLU|nr:hypothetical protein ILUMI_19410 [Ignelater luminosus]